MEEEYTGKKTQTKIGVNRPYVYNIIPAKLKELIDLNPIPHEGETEDEKYL